MSDKSEAYKEYLFKESRRHNRRRDGTEMLDGNK